MLSERKDDPKLAYARALLNNAEGKSDQALAMLDTLANGHDQFDRARAAVRAVELRLAAGVLNKTQAADALDKLLYAWRGDARELALRERVAELRGQTGGWRVALATLRQAATDFPDQAAPISDRLKDTFAAMIRDQDTRATPPIEFVAMLEENTDLVRDSSDNEAVEQPLADRLLALDLPGRAKPVFEKLMNQAKSPVAKARFGASLATLDSREGDDAGAISALDASQGSDLPSDLSEQRLILRAGSIARQGDSAGAASDAGAHANCSGDRSSCPDSGNRVGLGGRGAGVVRLRGDNAARHRHAGRTPDPHDASPRHGRCQSRSRREAGHAARHLRYTHRRRPAGRHVPAANR